MAEERKPKPKEVLRILYELGLIGNARSVIENQTFKSNRLSHRREALFYVMYKGSDRDAANFVSPSEVFEKFSSDHHISRDVVRKYASNWYKIVSLTLELDEVRAIRKYDCFRETIDRVLFEERISEEILDGFLQNKEPSLLVKVQISAENRRYLNKIAQSEDKNLEDIINSIIDDERLSDS